MIGYGDRTRTQTEVVRLSQEKYPELPLISQGTVGFLDVSVPPDFVPEETSGDVMVPEGGTVKLTCRARGHPEPHVQWRREDGGDIVIKEPAGQRTGGTLGKE
ncbi:hypothetical protein NQ318_006663 [Aromia moschata]|uniref:Ig-like domain-containing protein n=1 Tax=Aromia moschata TaxID=1265417 RepID=A0AAV8YQT7_9CUCU|nr:hypothetical protein NQ318_006663 [Aromia moschata]